MSLPFTTDQFLDVFAKYNIAVWPTQLVFNLLGVLCIVMTVRRARWSSRIINSILAMFWLWMGVAYHFLFFSKINTAAWLFGTIFILQSLIFIYAGVITRKLSFNFPHDVYGIGGTVILSYAFIIYPVLGYLVGHKYPAAPTFGVPCPTTIFTFGILLWAKPIVPGYILIIPLAWSIMGFVAALSLNMLEDVGLLAAGITGSMLIALRNTRARLAVDSSGKHNLR